MRKLVLVTVAAVGIMGCGAQAEVGSVAAPTAAVQADSGDGVSADGTKEAGKVVRLFALVEYTVPQKQFNNVGVEEHYLQKLLKDEGYVLTDITVRRNKNSLF